MGRLLPFKTETTTRPEDPEVLALDDEATDEALSALSSETARKILSALYEEPQTPPDLRDEVGTSLQNVHYHVERLEGADLIQPAGTGYSEKGTEMTVYAPRNEAFVLFAGQQHHRSRLRTALTRLLGAIGVLGLATLAVQEFFGGRTFLGGGDGGTAAGGGGDAGGYSADGGAGGAQAPANGSPTPEATSTPTPTDTQSGDVGIMEGGGGDAGTSTPTPQPTDDPMGTPGPAETPTPQPTETPVATETPAAADTATSAPAGTPTPAAEQTPVPTEGVTDGVTELAGSAGQGLDPALAFFLGGLFMLAVVGLWWYWGTR